MRLVSIQPTRFEVEAKQAGQVCERVVPVASFEPHTHTNHHTTKLHQFIRIHTIGQRKRRVLELRRGNLWTARGINTVDVVILHTELTMSAIRCPILKCSSHHATSHRYYYHHHHY